MKPQRLPLWKNAVDEAEKDGLLFYGGVIPFDWLESQFHHKRDQSKFGFAMIQFTGALKERGYILSQTGCNKTGVRILTKQEMAEHVKRGEFRKANQSTRAAICLGLVDTSDMEELDRAKHDHWQQKTALNAAISHHILRRRLLPSPEMVIKSIKQIS